MVYVTCIIIFCIFWLVNFFCIFSFEKLSIYILQNAACVLVPGGFGDRGVKGMLLAAKYAREKRVPYLGICLGMQISVIEFARNVRYTLIIYAPLLSPHCGDVNLFQNMLFRFWAWKGRTALSLIRIPRILL